MKHITATVWLIAHLGHGAVGWHPQDLFAALLVFGAVAGLTLAAMVRRARAGSHRGRPSPAADQPGARAPGAPLPGRRRGLGVESAGSTPQTTP
jgi:hypothetical protein